MPGTIVAGYDGTAGCQAAMDEALRLAGELSADLVVVFAYAAGPVGGEAADLLAVLRERGNTVANEALERAARAGIQARAELVNDRPAEALASVAAEEGARMIVVGSHGERPLKAAVLGSTPNRLGRLTDVPVLVVRGRE